MNDRRRRALVVNDTEEILELFRDILDEMGYDTVLMSYAPRELSRVRDARPDLIIVDFLMGDREMLGWQLLQKLKMDRATDSIPIIACTAAVKHVQEQQGYLTEQGVQVVLKPFNVVQLEEAVRAAEQQPITARQIQQEASEKGGRRDPLTPDEEQPPAA